MIDEAAKSGGNGNGGEDGDEIGAMFGAAKEGVDTVLFLNSEYLRC